MTMQHTAPVGRRALLAAAFGSLAALVANAFGRPSPVAAADVVLGGTNTSASTTVIENTTDSDTVLRLRSEDGLALSAASSGQPAIFAHSAAGPAIQAHHAPRNVLIVTSDEQVGVLGSAPIAGIRGISSDHRAGVYGSVGQGAPGTPPPNVGVYGWSTADGGVSYGVVGRSTAPGGIGVFGRSDAGTGILASSANGLALSTIGRVSFDTSGIGTIANGNASVVVDPGTPVADGTRILVTLHGDPGGSKVLKRVQKNAGDDTFTVQLTGPADNGVKFSWFVIG